MKRKYKNEKVKAGDWVYFYDDYYGCYETKCKYKVIVATDDDVIVEVSDNEVDNIKGWLADGTADQIEYGLPNGIRCWHIRYWTKAFCRLEIE